MSQFIHLCSEYLKLQKGRRGRAGGEGARILRTLTVQVHGGDNHK